MNQNNIDCLKYLILSLVVDSKFTISECIDVLRLDSDAKFDESDLAKMIRAGIITDNGGYYVYYRKWQFNKEKIIEII